MNRLAQWLEENGISRSAFAERIGVSPSYVTLLCSDEAAWPGRGVAARIAEATDGAITINDFLPPKPAEASA